MDEVDEEIVDRVDVMDSKSRMRRRIIALRADLAPLFIKPLTKLEPDLSRSFPVHFVHEVHFVQFFYPHPFPVPEHPDLQAWIWLLSIRCFRFWPVNTP